MEQKIGFEKNGSRLSLSGKREWYGGVGAKSPGNRSEMNAICRAVCRYTGEVWSMNKVSIVIVEDELMIAEDLSMTLKDKGYEVIAAVTSMEEAAEICRQKRPDVILMNLDLHTTQQTLSAASRIRKEFNVPLIYLTTDCRDSPAACQDPSPCVRKPFSEKELCAIVETVLNEDRRNPR
jgi:CheY-like chemotaxis protein